MLNPINIIMITSFTRLRGLKPLFFCIFFFGAHKRLTNHDFWLSDNHYEYSRRIPKVARCIWPSRSPFSSQRWRWWVSVAIYNDGEEDDDVCPIGYSEEISDGWWVIGANDLARRIARHVPPSIWPADTPVSPSSPPRNRIRVRFARGACRLSFLPIANPPI